MSQKYHPARKPGTVLVALVDVDGELAPMALVAERIPSLSTYRVVAPSGAQRSISRASAVLDDLPTWAWNRAREVAYTRSTVALDESLLGGADGSALLSLLRGAGAPVPSGDALAERRARRRKAADEGERALGFKVA